MLILSDLLSWQGDKEAGRKEGPLRPEKEVGEKLLLDLYFLAPEMILKQRDGGPSAYPKWAGDVERSGVLEVKVGYT